MGKRTIVIEGMHCTKCAERLHKILNAVDGINANVDFENKTAYVESTSILDNQELKNIIEFAGYKVVSIK